MKNEKSCIEPEAVVDEVNIRDEEFIGFKQELEALINSHCIENLCDMPDFLLAEMICNFIKVTGISIKKNLDWHGCNSVCHPNKESI